MTSLLNLSLGSSNVFAGFGHPDADLEQARAILAAKIMGVLDGHGLSTRAAARLTGVSRVDFSRIRSTRLGGFTLERMLAVLGKLDQRLDSQSLGKLWDALDVEAILLSPEDQRIFAESVLNPPDANRRLAPCL
jgi:predicted XRE-type DNA-binding protein